MPMSFSALQAYHHYLDSYQNKHTSRYDTHSVKDLKKRYREIQLKSCYAPCYLTEPTFDDVKAACLLKESAHDFAASISSLHAPADSLLFSQKNVYSSSPALVSAQYQPYTALSVPSVFELQVDCFATPQIQTGSFLPANQEILMAPGNYSFDITTAKLHYELQFTIQEHDTHEHLQRKIMRLVNQSNIGIEAELLEKDSLTALQFTSSSVGAPLHLLYHYEITEEGTSQNTGVVNYLGLNRTIYPAQNAKYSVNGTCFSSYANSFQVFESYQLTLHPENGTDLLGTPVEIGLYADTASLSKNINTFVNSYNTFLKKLAQYSPSQKTTEAIHKPFYNQLRMHRKELENLGITLDSASTLHFAEPTQWSTSSPLSIPIAPLQSVGSHMLQQLETISLDPLSYFGRRICTYSNFEADFINPYVTSSYSGLIFQVYC